jgi:hypothetical protein
MGAGQDALGCDSCGEGRVVPTNIRGQRFAHRGQGFVEVRQDLILPVCSACGDMRLGEVEAAVLDSVLERAFRLQGPGAKG